MIKTRRGVYYSQEALLKQKIFESFTKIIRVRPHIQKKGFTDSHGGPSAAVHPAAVALLVAGK
jgi:hypothetical protein